MNIYESFQSALQSVKSNKLRSFLTMLGIIIGISSVITIVSIGDGAKNFITSEFDNIGTNLINVKINNSDGNVEKKDYFTLDDVEFLKEKIPEIDKAIASMQTGGNLKTENKSKQVYLDATNPDSVKTNNIKMIKGRYLSEHDLDTKKNVTAIDETTAKKLFNDVDVVGNRVKMKSGDKSLDLTIIGVFKNPNENMAATFGADVPGIVVVPITIGDKIVRYTDISSLSVAITDMNRSEEISSKIVRMLENKHKNSGIYSAENAFKQLDSINKTLKILTTVLGTIAAISLLVGGIGVMNIMLVSVTERTREIGIRKAIGAKTRDIKIQFLMESIILCLIGGTIGTILGISTGKIAGLALKVEVPISIKVILISFMFSSAVGIFFGLYPANKAAKLDPIEALRYE